MVENLIIKGDDGMTDKRFDWDVCDGDVLFYENGAVIDYDDVLEILNNLSGENEQLKKEIKQLHQKIFEMRTNIALERTEISRQTYTGKKNEKEYLTAKEFLDEIEKW